MKVISVSTLIPALLAAAWSFGEPVLTESRPSAKVHQLEDGSLYRIACCGEKPEEKAWFLEGVYG